MVLIVFMLQNTRSVEVTFLWMHGTLPLALALLITGVGVAILAMVVGGARITQLRRLRRERTPMTYTPNRMTMISLSAPSTPRLRMEPTGSRRTLLDAASSPS